MSSNRDAARLARQARKLESDVYDLLKAAHDLAQKQDSTVPGVALSTIYNEYFRATEATNKLGRVAAALETIAAATR